MFVSFDIQNISRSENSKADLLSKLATLVPDNLPKKSFFEMVKRSNIEETPTMLQVDNKPSRIDPLVRYLKEEVLPRDPKEIQKLRNQVSCYVLHEEKLYKRSYFLSSQMPSSIQSW